MSHTELPLKTYEDRLDYIDSLKKRVGTDISLKEWFALLRDWTMYEIALRRKHRYDRLCKKYAKKLNDTFTIFAFREDLNDPQ